MPEWAAWSCPGKPGWAVPGTGTGNVAGAGGGSIPPRPPLPGPPAGRAERVKRGASNGLFCWL